MRDHDTSTVRELMVALHAVEVQLRAARCGADLERLIALTRCKQATLHELRRRRLHRISLA